MTPDELLPLVLLLSLLPLVLLLSLLPLLLLVLLPELVLVSVLVVPCSCPTHRPAPVTIATTSPPRLTSELVVHFLPLMPIVPPRLGTRLASPPMEHPGSDCARAGRTLGAR
ncbi:hypothetical protein [Curtobacterium luteum]|uniref:hypothetical protein n=1 Tax=Curtobacterium luteum TaxID=33881 RepID=UPI00187C4012|nr:hypothetical protein [Curtobacterium luteum]